MKHRHQVFVNEMLQHGDNVKAYLAAYPKCKPSSARNAANRLLQHPEVEQSIHETKRRIRTEIESELRRKLEEEILSELQIKLLLTKIATGQHETEKTFCLKDGGCETVKVKPTHHQVLRALYMLARMHGLLSPAIARSAAPAATKQSRELSAPVSSRDCSVGKEAASDTSGDSSLRKASVRNDSLDGAASAGNDGLDRQRSVCNNSLDGAASVRNGGFDGQGSVQNDDGGEQQKTTEPVSVWGGRPTPSWIYDPKGGFSEYYPADYRGCRWDPDDPNTQEQFHGYLTKREQELKQQLTTIQTRMAKGSVRLRELYDM